MFRCDFRLVCNVYISCAESSFVDRARSLIPHKIAHTFVDQAYGRTNFTLVSSSCDHLVNHALRLSALAIESLDLNSHQGSHPRLGIVDHIAITDITQSAAEEAMDCREKIGRRLAEDLGCAVYLYKVE